MRHKILESFKIYNSKNINKQGKLGFKGMYIIIIERTKFGQKNQITFFDKFCPAKYLVAPFTPTWLSAKVNTD